MKDKPLLLRGRITQLQSLRWGLCVTLGTATLVHPSILADKLLHPYRSVQAFPLLCLPHLQLSPLPPMARTETFITLDDRPLRMGWSPCSDSPLECSLAPIQSPLLRLPLLLQSHQLISPGDFACFLCFPCPIFSLNPGFGFQNS